LRHPKVREWRHARSTRTSLWTRNSLRKAHRAFVLKNRKPFAGYICGAVVLTAAILRWTPGGPTVRGFAAGATASILSSGLFYIVVSATGTVAKQSGVDAAVSTADELRRLRRSGWRVLHGLTLDYGDVDHFLIGHGCVFALETKWSAQPWVLNGSDERINKATAQIRRGAERTRKLLQTEGLKVEVSGLVVLWGPAADPLAATVPLFDQGVIPVTITHGRQLRSFIKDRAEQRDDSNDLAVWNALAKHIELRDAYNAKKDPAPPLLSAQLWQLYVGLALGSTLIIGLANVAKALAYGNPVVTDGTFVGGVVLIGMGAYRANKAKPNRLVVVGITMAVASMVVLVAYKTLQTR
jgi:Nuclease-related domain